MIADLLTGGAQVPGGRTRWWHGFGIGIAAGVKLTPLIFVPYLLLIRKYRQAATATAVFAATVALGYAILPRDSRTYWADRLFLNANRIVFLGTRGNQSLRGIVTRLARSVNSGSTPWIVLAILVAVVGLVTAAALYRAGQPVPAMLACALTGLTESTYGNRIHESLDNVNDRVCAIANRASRRTERSSSPHLPSDAPSSCSIRPTRSPRAGASRRCRSTWTVRCPCKQPRSSSTTSRVSTRNSAT